VQKCGGRRYGECRGWAIWSSSYNIFVEVGMHKGSICAEGKFLQGLHTIGNKLSVVMCEAWLVQKEGLVWKAG
jgi:hypothetical protein